MEWMADPDSRDATPVGRRVVLGMLGLGVAGVVFGDPVSRGIGDILAPLTSGDAGIASLVPGADNFQIYTVVSGYPATPPDYLLTVDGLVDRPLSLTVADLEAMPATRLVKTFQCVTGWLVPDVHWTGVRLGHLLDEAGVTKGATALHFKSFDGVYTESLTLEQARLSDVIVAYQMLDGPVTREHGGPVRLYVPPMYGYKSIKWLSTISVVDRVEPGYWEDNGYAVDAWIGRSNGLISETTGS
jgi:DMSO/TMAO reductase YedYZ molybdopterin-dependent catalytic subunit